MKVSKFNRNKALDPLQKYRIAQNKANYLATRGKLRILDSFHTENQTWGALCKAWTGYKIGLSKYELEKMRYYALVIQKLQRELGIQVASFPNLDIYPVEGETCSQGDDITYYNVEHISKEDMREW
ncbi:MAG: hypothetical protein ACR2IS_15235 [Nitrososphaeraceae archaeon]